MNLFYNTSRFFIFFCFLFGLALGQVQAQITLPYTESFEENIFGDFTQDTNDIGLFPIAAKVHRIDFDGGQFVNTTLLSDRRNLL